jgi:hypothetical protein
MSGEQTSCPLCGSGNAKVSPLVDGRVNETACPTCGRYEVTDQAYAQIQSEPSLKGYLAVATRHASDSDQPISLRTDTWRQYAVDFAGASIVEKRRRLLELLRRSTNFFGQPSTFDASKDWPLVRAGNQVEVNTLLSALRKDGLLSATASHSGSGPVLTYEGWSATEPAFGGVQGFGVVAMSFAEELRDAFDEGIRPAVETDCGLQIIRVDSAHFNEKICDRIVADLRRSQFVVADFTLQSEGVYFEAGFALALGRIVIWTCRKDEADQLHFDTRQYPHILWETAADLRIKLADRLRAVVPGAKL